MGIVSTASHSIFSFDSVHLFLVSSIILSSKPHICANNTVQSAKNKRYSTFKVQKLHFGEFCILAFFFLGGGGIRVLNLYFSARHVIDLSKKNHAPALPIKGETGA